MTAIDLFVSPRAAPFGSAARAAPEGYPVSMRFLDWIWHVRGSLALAPEQSVDDAFDRLGPLFRQTGTTHERTGDTLTFRKKGQPAQDRMAVFDDGVLRIEGDMAGLVLRYRLASRALLFCFLAPLLFLCFAQATIFLPMLDRSPTEAKARKPKIEKAPAPLNPIDKALGAPAPEKPKKGADKGDDDKKPSPTSGYVFAGIFAALYIVGRIFESRRIKALFRKSLLDA